MLYVWPADRAFATEKELRGLTGKILHLCTVVRIGEFFVRRMLLQLGLTPIETNKFAKGAGARRIALGVEFHADLAFWRLL